MATESVVEQIIQFRSEEDPALPNRPNNCPFANPNLFTGAHLFSYRTSADNGEIVNSDVREIGRARGCGVITDPTFTPGSQIPVYLEADLPDGTYTATGVLLITAKDTPETGIVLTAGNLRIDSGPAGSVAGVATSNSVLNLQRLPG